MICQIVYSKIQGDYVLCSAYSHELPRYGITVGLKNWAAAYATGLLLARRTLQKLNLNELYVGVVVPDGSVSQVKSLGDDNMPFKAFLDVGVARTTTGAKVFAAMKGASDGGVFVPHNEKRFPGYDKEKSELDAEVLRSYIFGGHVADYMRQVQESDDNNVQFAGYLKKNITPDSLEQMYKEAHQKIREDPSPSPKKEVKNRNGKRRNQTKITLEERKQRVQQKKVAFFSSLQ